MVFDAFVGARRPGNRRRISELGRSHPNRARRTSLASVSEPGTVGSGIAARDRAQLHRHRGGRPRRRPRGDRRAQRLPGAGRRHRHQHVPHHGRRPRRRAREGRGRRRRPGRPVRGVHPRRPARRARQLRRDPQRDAPRDHRGGSPRRSGTSGTARSWSTRCSRRPRRATPRSVRRSRAPCCRSAAPPRRRPRRCSSASRRSARGTCSPPAPPRPARRSRGPPTSCRPCATPGWSTPAAAVSW